MTDLTSSEPSAPLNPYNPDAPTSDPGVFVGREEIFTFIRQRLVSGRHPQAVTIIGRPRMGKTSLLWQVPNHIESRYLTAYLDLREVRFEEPGALFLAMAEVTLTALENGNVSNYRLTSIPAPAEFPDPQTWFFEQFYPTLLAVLRLSRRIVYLFDDVSYLLNAVQEGKLPAEIGQTLGELIARDERLDIIFTIDAGDEARLESFDLLSEPMLQRRLTLLDETAAETFIRQSVSFYYQLEPAAVETILALANGHPYLLQVFGKLIWDRSAERQHKGMITESDVTAILDRALRQSDPILRLAWDESTADEQLALSALTDLTNIGRGEPISAEQIRTWLLRSGSEPPDETALASALRRLEYREIVRSPSRGVYQLAVGLQYQWLLRQSNVEFTPSLAGEIVPRRFPAWLVIPVLLIFGAIAGIALIFGQAATQSTGGKTDIPVTNTLALDFQATRDSISATETFQALPSPTSSNTPSPTVTFTPSNTATATLTFTPTFTATPSNTTTPSATLTLSVTFTASVTNTPSQTLTPSATTSQTATYTPSSTLTDTATFTSTATFTATLTPSFTATATPTASNTATGTQTLTATITDTATPSATSTSSVTPPFFPSAQVPVPATGVKK